MTQTEDFDIAVIGGGPAGTSAAITAAREGFTVALLEGSSFPRHKVCGEFISSEALPLLKSLIGNDNLLSDVPLVRKARVFLDDRVVEFKIEPAAASLSRYALDLNLWRSAIAAGVWTRDRAKVTWVHRERSRFSVQLEGRRLGARVVINATGRWSNLFRSQPTSSAHWIGLKQHFLEDTASTDCDLYFFPGGYSGVQSLGNGTTNVAAMVRAEVARSLTSVFEQNRELMKRSRNWRPVSEAVATSPLLFTPPRTSAGGTVLVGDAAAFIDPFAGDGISMALHSGCIAALTLARYLRGECSLDSALGSYARSYRELLKPALGAAARLRLLLQLPKRLRLTALSILQFPPLARLAVQKTRVREIA